MKYQILINGMSCEHCSSSVKESLLKINGITNVTVDLKNKNAIIDSDLEINSNEIKDSIEDIGFEFVDIKTL